VARARAEALRDALSETVATKAVLNELALSVKRDLGEVGDGLGTLIAKLDHKIEITARDLTIKGAGGLVVIAGLIIGFKLFG
jgi:hypothetical protein